MKYENGNYVNLENLGNGERVARVIVSTLAIVFAMESSIAGTTLFAVICFLGIALAMTGIVGWDPVRSLSAKSEAKHKESSHHIGSHGHHA